jgi:hypothetical protein
MLKNSLSLYELSLDRVHLFLRDAARTMSATMNRLGVASEDCLAHKIHLV